MDSNAQVARDLALIGLLAAARSMVTALNDDDTVETVNALADLTDALAPFEKVGL